MIFTLLTRVGYRQTGIAANFIRYQVDGLQRQLEQIGYVPCDSLHPAAELPLTDDHADAVKARALF